MFSSSNKHRGSCALDASLLYPNPLSALLLSVVLPRKRKNETIAPCCEPCPSIYGFSRSISGTRRYNLGVNEALNFCFFFLILDMGVIINSQSNRASKTSFLPSRSITSQDHVLQIETLKVLKYVS